jgi:GT2 family glycosyltransferase
MKPILSIVIVSWNAQDYLLRCLKLIMAETSDFEVEIIVVDNASTDGTPELIREFFPQVKLICNGKNLGFAKANNIAIKESTGEYICLVNSDILVGKDCFKKLLEFMEENPRMGMIGPRTVNPDGTLQRSCFSFPSAWNNFCRALALDSLFPKSPLFGRRLMTFWPHDTVRGVDALNGCFLMVRREALNEVGLLDETFFIYGEDIDWCKRFREAGWDVVFFPGAEAIHYGGASSSNAPIRFYIEMHRADMQYWEKHHGRFGKTYFLIITWLHQMIRMGGMTALYITRPARKTEALYKIKRSASCIRWLFTS